MVSDGRIGPYWRVPEELQQHGINLKTPLASRAWERRPHAAFEATDSKGAAVTVQAYDVASLPPHTSITKQLLLYCSLVHPHTVRLRQLIPTPRQLIVVTEGAHGGNIFTLARRAGPAGLAPPAARFIFQQVLATALFLQRSGIHMHEISPSGFLVHWNERGMPIVKLAVLCLHREAQKAALGSGKVFATMLICPQEVRRETMHGDPTPYACARDAWAAAVVLYFLLYGRWPFTRQQMQAWAAGGQWVDDVHVDYSGLNGRPAPESDVVPLLRQVFSRGGLPAAQFAVRCPSVETMLEHAWVAGDMPEGAADMADTFWQKTQARRESREFSELKKGIQTALAECVPERLAGVYGPPRPGAAQAAPAVRMPPGYGMTSAPVA